MTGNGLADLLLKGAYWGGADEQSFVPTSLIRWRDYELYATDTWRARPGLTITYGLRFSRLPQTTQDDNLLGNFLLSVYDPKKGSDPLNGLIFPKELKLPDKGILGGDANLKGIDVDARSEKIIITSARASELPGSDWKRQMGNSIGGGTSSGGRSSNR